MLRPPLEKHQHTNKSFAKHNLEMTHDRVFFGQIVSLFVFPATFAVGILIAVIAGVM